MEPTPTATRAVQTAATGQMPRNHRRTTFFAIAMTLAAAAGCQPSDETQPTSTEETAAAAIHKPLDAKALEQSLAETLRFTLEKRRLNTTDHGAWQILHGVLAYQLEFPVIIDPSGTTRPAVRYALEGGRIAGWTFEPGDVLDPETGRRGLRAIVEPGTKKGQGHADQWLAILAQCGLPPEEQIQVGTMTFTLADLLAQVQRDVPRNLEREYSWTLIGLTTYLPTDARWQANDGQTWSIERLVESEIDQDIHRSACGGTHRLIGVAMALNRHLASGGELEGVWQRADQLIQQSIQDARRLQNPDGSFSTHYFERPGMSPDLALALSTTGHVLEFLTLAMNDEQLAESWVGRAADHLCHLFRETENLPLECGALYHAVHGLVVYQQRRFPPP